MPFTVTQQDILSVEADAAVISVENPIVIVLEEGEAKAGDEVRVVE